MDRILKQLFVSLKKTDLILWLTCIAASTYGLILIASMSRAGTGSGMGFFVTQLGATILGYTIAILIACLDYNYLVNKWFIFAIVSFVLLIYTLFFGWGPAGVDDKTWISLGPISLQPSELVKIFFLITFAKHIQFLDQIDKLTSFIGLVTLAIHAIIPIALIHLQGDDGTALVFLLMFAFMTFGCKIHMRYFLITIIALFTAIPLAWNFILNEDQRSRFLAVFDLDSSMMSSGWQQYQGKLSIASGGLTGRGLFAGPRVASGIVPFQENDFIFTVAGEELGFIGCTLLIAILFLICLRSLRIASLAKDIAGKCMAFGFFGMIFSQATINISMCLGFIPVIGITLPFFSSGGSSVLCLCLGVGLIQSVFVNKSDDKKIHIQHTAKTIE